MITATHIYGKSIVSKSQLLKVEIANQTAQAIYSKRDLKPYRDELKPGITLEEVEHIVVNAIKDVMKS